MIRTLASATALLALSFTTPLAAQDAPVTEDELRAQIEVLASDAFGGRKPGTAGDEMTIAYLAGQWAAAGLVSGTEDPDNPWFQPVPLVEQTPTGSSASFSANGKAIGIAPEDILLSGSVADISAEGELVYVGFGATADGAVTPGVEGKIAVMLFGNPEFAGEGYPSRRARLDGLRAAGAKAVLTVFPPQIPWSQVQGSFGGSSIDLAGDGAATLGGFLNGTAAAALMKPAGIDPEAMRKLADDPEFKGRDLGVAGTLSASADVRKFTSHNVIGKIPGADPEAGALLFLGHWDHLGTCRPEGEEDRICNGAVDNASGISVLIAVARRLASGPRPDRTIYFMGTTSEEQGLLGARYFADHPVVPLDDIVLALNVDTIAIHQAGAPVAIIGRGTTPITDQVDEVARSLGRTIEPSEDATKGFIQRQDGYMLTAKGVPALMVGGSFADLEFLQNYLRGDYHGPGDEADEDLVLSGAAEDADLHVALGRYFSDTESYPGD